MVWGNGQAFYTSSYTYSISIHNYPVGSDSSRPPPTFHLPWCSLPLCPIKKSSPYTWYGRWSCMFLGGLIIGRTVYASKCPRIALYCHIEGVSYGGSMITIGLLILKKSSLGILYLRIVYHLVEPIVSWPMWLSQILQSFWGTNKMNCIVFHLVPAVR